MLQRYGSRATRRLSRVGRPSFVAIVVLGIGACGQMHVSNVSSTHPVAVAPSGTNISSTVLSTPPPPPPDPRTTLRAADCSGDVSAPTARPTSTVNQFLRVQITYQAGWNLMTFVGDDIAAYAALPGPFYVYLGDSPLAGYLSVDASAALESHGVVWTYLPNPLTVQVAGKVEALTAWVSNGEVLQIGNDQPSPATVQGASTVYTYDPMIGFQRTTRLQPGQGAFAYAPNGCGVELVPD